MQRKLENRRHARTHLGDAGAQVGEEAAGGVGVAGVGVGAPVEGVGEGRGGGSAPSLGADRRRGVVGGGSNGGSRCPAWTEPPRGQSAEHLRRMMMDWWRVE